MRTSQFQQLNGRNLSSTCYGRNIGAMNTPNKSILHKSIFYLPRNEEMFYENKLIENIIKFQKILDQNKKFKNLVKNQKNI